MLGSNDDWDEKLRRAEEEIATSRQRRQELQEIVASLGRFGRQLGSLTAGSSPEAAGEAAGVAGGGEPAGEAGGVAGGEPAEPGEGGPAPGQDGPPPGEGQPPDIEPGGRGGAGKAPTTPGRERGDGDGPGSRPGLPGRGEGGWRARWRQAILERNPQTQLERGGVLASALADRMRSLEEAIDATSRFFEDVAGKLRTGEAHRPIPLPLVKEVVTSDHFRQLTARLLADFVREPIRVTAHSGARATLRTEAGHPQAMRKGKEVVLVKTEELWWWILIILLIFVLFFFVFPLGGAAGQ
ncbi:MAG: hypothetical protein QME93_05020 [Bacillota bacterium]|nr:hypothetical protein [Bacillota bacterium]MDI7249413.1 hypothetical protein [Bacillota bacterium]